jgi:cytosine/adenosine deaminase-related metal-dependent hydrolase
VTAARPLALKGHVVPMRADDPARHGDGVVYLADGVVAHVAEANDPAPDGFEDTSVVDCGSSYIFPGLMDLHSHIAYNALPLWSWAQDEPFLHRDIWPGRPTYGPEVSWPAWTLAHGAPESLIAYVQVRALAGGTTTIQGWPGTTRRPANQLVRNADDQSFGDDGDPTLTSVMTLDDAALRRKGQQLAEGRGFIYHCAEGQFGSIVSREFDDAAAAGCMRQNLIAIHMTAVGAEQFDRWTQLASVHGDSTSGSVVWSPFSNLWLYGETTRVPEARASGVNVCLGTDWGPSGTKNLLGELKAARLAAEDAGWTLSDRELVEMCTTNPGRAMGRLWGRPAGQLVDGGVADVAVVAPRDDDPFTSLVAAREDDVELVVVDGAPVYGTPARLRDARAAGVSAVPIGEHRRRVVITEPDDPDRKWFFSRVLDNLRTVRRDPQATLDAPLASRETHLRPGPAAGDLLQLSLDMPGGPNITAGPPPPGVEVEIAPIPSLHHDRTWLRSITGRGFHRGVLDRLAEYYD